ncbi:AraC family transcriptional regulator, partial [Pseudomonas aeruginosa]|nr:AraC family transcriptional regulator [Pseudomonas aeruginosa]
MLSRREWRVGLPVSTSLDRAACPCVSTFDLIGSSHGPTR